MYRPEQSRLIARAIDRLQTRLAHGMPAVAGHVQHWMQRLAGTAQLHDYFQHPAAFPSLLLPWWAENMLVDTHTPELQTQLAYSTINGYYYIRLIDNIMDGDVATELWLLPALNFFHTQFQNPYQQLFSNDHPFWDIFTATWLRSGEVAMQETRLTEINMAQFKQVSAQKVCAAKIPVAAVCYHHHKPEYIEAWSQVIDGLGCWHQMLNDLFDWHKDYRQNACTYFLSEASRRKQAGESLVAWVAREGFVWGSDTLRTWMSDLKIMANDLPCPQLSRYLVTREEMLLDQQEKVGAGLNSLANLVSD